MFEIISLIAPFLGWNAKDLLAKYEKIRKENDDKKFLKRQAQEIQFATQKTKCSLISDYYGLADSTTGLKRYSASFCEKQVETTLYTKEEFLSINRPPLEIKSISLSSNHPDNIPPNIPKAAEIYTPTVLERINRMGLNIWDDPIYRLISHGQARKLEFTFAETSFLSYRFTTGLLGDEITDALVETSGDSSNILSDRNEFLAIREALLPNLSSLIDYKSRNCSGGIGVMFALARGAPYNDFVIPIQLRSQNVTDGRGEYGLLPQGFHQPFVHREEEANVYWSAFREIFEEVFGGEEARRESKRLKHDWYFDECAGIGYFRDHEGAYEIKVVSFGINALSGKYEITLLLAVRDTWYWKTFENNMSRNWESKTVHLISTKDEKQILSSLANHTWTNEGVFHFLEGLSHLKTIDSKRANYPDIIRSLG